MPLPWTEIRDPAIKFSREWQDAGSEQAEAQTFWNEFFEVFGVLRRRVAGKQEKALESDHCFSPTLLVGGLACSLRKKHVQ